MMRRLFDFVAMVCTSLQVQLGDGANALAAYTRRHGDTVGFNITFKYTTDADATYAVKLTHCDTVGGTYTDVAAADMSGNTGTFTQAQLAALGHANELHVNYHGSKSFIKPHITTANITDNVNTVYTRVTVVAAETGLKSISGDV